MSSVSEDENEYYYPDEVQDENAFYQGDYQATSNEELPNSQEQIDTFIAGQKAQNTVRKTRSDLNILKKYMESTGKGDIRIENLPTEELDHLLLQYFQYLQYTGNILKDEVFEKSRKVLAARRKSLVKSGKVNNPETTRAVTDEEEDLLFTSGQFGDSGPEALQRSLWWLLSLHFGFRARDESRKLRWGDVQLQTTNDGHEVLVCLGERGTKTRTGQEKGHQRAFQSKAFATNDERCPVKLYKKFRDHRPVEMLTADAAFFLAIKQKRSPNDKTWYMKAPLGKNQIGKFLNTAAKNAGISQKLVLK
ncbi:Zinc finger MYM-type protein 2 [Exaiptasia diaphana]|nr:Zinc finger MYM-type protein 2 [Exaiptasia diaphana]